MEFAELIRKRRSIRSYQKREIPDEILMRILDSARLAPSAKNLQPWKFVIVKDENRKLEIARLCKERLWIADASVIIAGVAINPDYRMGCGEPSSQIDISIAFTHMILAAANEGFGSCWLGTFKIPEVKNILGIPERFPLVSLLAIGYPAENPPPKDRKDINEIFCIEKWSE